MSGTIQAGMPPNALDPLADIRRLGNPRFVQLVHEMLDTHVKKAAGYSGADNPDTWTNFREAKAWGLSPLAGCLVRMGDKYRRVQNLRRNADNDRVGESIRDTLMDLANYAIIAVCLLEEEAAETKGSWPPLGPDGTERAGEAFDVHLQGKSSLYLCTDSDHRARYGEAYHQHEDSDPPDALFACKESPR